MLHIISYDNALATFAVMLLQSLHRPATPADPDAAAPKTRAPEKRRGRASRYRLQFFLYFQFSVFDFPIFFVRFYLNFQYILYTSFLDFVQYIDAIQRQQAGAILTPSAFLRQAWGSTRMCTLEALGVR